MSTPTLINNIKIYINYKVTLEPINKKCIGLPVDGTITLCAPVNPNRRVIL
jgi:hypothetical protein